MKKLILAIVLTATVATGEPRDGRQINIPESHDALVVTCGIAAFALVAAGVATGPHVALAVPLVPALCDIWGTAGRPSRQ